MKKSIITITLVLSLLFFMMACEFVPSLLNRDEQAPTGTFIINGDDDYTGELNVTLDLSRVSGASKMRFGDTTEERDKGAWEDYTLQKEWTLSGDDGEKVVYGEFADEWNNSLRLNDNIILDASVPTGVFVINEDSPYTNNTTSSLNLSNIENAIEMRFGNSEWERDTATWETYTGTRTWDLSSGDGAKIVYGEFRNAMGIVHKKNDAITVDSVPPIVILSNKPNSITNVNSTDMGVSASAGDLVTYIYKLDSGAWSAEIDASSNILETLIDGNHTVYVRGKDIAGNWQAVASPTTHAWEIDTVPPTIGWTHNLPGSGNWTNDSNMDITISGADTYQYNLDSGGWIDTSANLSKTVVDGNHSIQVRGYDLAGNLSTNTPTTNWKLDTVPPEVITFSETSSSGRQVWFTLIGTDNGGSGVVEYRITSSEGGDTGWKTSMYTYLESNIIGWGGPYDVILRVWCKDEAGNISDSYKSLTYTVPWGYYEN